MSRVTRADITDIKGDPYEATSNSHEVKITSGSTDDVETSLTGIDVVRQDDNVVDDVVSMLSTSSLLHPLFTTNNYIPR
ncbi:hypothetical protein M0802_007141 [Mischocyttarus mexicanus]|nr:hypothetical protein M0802_007141 [Mischocyttarus mexicanus]